MKRRLPFGLNAIWWIKNVQYLYLTVWICLKQVIHFSVLHVLLFGNVKLLNKQIRIVWIAKVYFKIVFIGGVDVNDCDIVALSFLYSLSSFGFQFCNIFLLDIDTQLVFESEGNQASW